MKHEIEEGRVLQGRFVLTRALRVGASSQLWMAHDDKLDAPILLRISLGAALSGSRVRELALQDARRHRQLHHPHLARLLDVHEEEDLLVTSISPHDGELLADHLVETGPMPYRRVVEMIRPVLEAVQHLHDHGAEHGRLDAEHLLAEGKGRWILLPGDGTAPARSDLRQIGRLLASLLTGGRGVAGDRQLNDAAERLHEGRTVPALLNQLVNDLQSDDATQRPAGVREVLGRLDELERYVTPEPVTRPAAVSVPAPPPPPAAPARRLLGPRLLWLLVPVALVVGVLIVRPRGQDPAPGATPAEVVDRAPVPAAQPTPAAPAADAAAEALARARADEALSRALDARRAADEIGAVTWGGAAYGEAAATSGRADAAYLEKRFDDASTLYGTAADSFEAIVASKDAARERLLADGRAALAGMDAARATSAFQGVLMIDPGNDEATTGLRRASTLDRLGQLLARGAEHEREERFPLAHIDYAAATELDPLSGEAAEAFERIKGRLADDRFQAMMSRGLDAYHDGDLDEARTRLLEAQRFRPESEEAAAALGLVAEARVRREVDRLRAQGGDEERQEAWQAAWNTYRQALAIDADIQFAQEGRTRCERMIRLVEHARHFLDHPEELVQRGLREQAATLVGELADVPSKGPQMSRLHGALAEQVRLASTPVRVLLRSDEKTEVDVYRVGRHEPFRALELEMLPGAYTVVGHRNGYKDVRLTLQVKPGAGETVLDVICTETIR